MQLKYTSDIDNLRHGLEITQDENRSYARDRLARILALGASIAIIIAVLALIGIVEKAPELHSDYWWLGVGVLASAVLSCGYFYRVNRRARDFVRLVPHLPLQVTLRTSPQHLRLESELGTSQLSKIAVLQYRRNRHGVALILHGGVTIMIPASAFVDETQMSELQSWVAAPADV